MKKQKKKKAVTDIVRKSPINYFSDLFVMVMVVAWIIVIIIMIIMAVYATVVLSDVYMWSDVANLVSVPLTAGGAIWMVKNSVQHAIANNKGDRAPMDFPPVPDTEIEYEKEIKSETKEESEELG